MIMDLGIPVFDEVPDQETLLLAGEPTFPDEEFIEEAEASMGVVDGDFGRTSDPVRMYMREMGSVDLLTREGEIELAKKIEDGLKQMIQAISACPLTIEAILELANRLQDDQVRIDEVVDGLIAVDDFDTEMRARKMKPRMMIHDLMIPRTATTLKNWKILTIMPCTTPAYCV